MHAYQTGVAVIGAGLAGITTALELLDYGLPVILLDGSPDGRLDGQANEAFGGMLLINTPEQARTRISDAPELLLADWRRAAEFSSHDYWPLYWAELYAEHCRPMIYDWLRNAGIRFFPSVQWVERGLWWRGHLRYKIAGRHLPVELYSQWQAGSAEYCRETLGFAVVPCDGKHRVGFSKTRSSTSM